MNARRVPFAVGLVLGLSLFALMAPTSGFPSRPTFQQVRVGSQAAALASAHIDVQAPSGTDPAIATYRASSGVGVGVGRLRFDGLDVAAARQPYGLIQAEIQGNTASAQSGALTFQTANAGVTAEKMRITAIGEVVARGVAVTAYKAPNTDRTSTTTPTADPQLAVSLAGGRAYAIRIVLNFSNITTATQGANFNLNFPAGATDGNCSLRNGASGTATPWTPGIALNTTYSLGSFAAAGTTYPTEIDCGITTSGAGALTLHWAQATSSGNATRLGTGSYMTAMQLN